MSLIHFYVLISNKFFSSRCEYPLLWRVSRAKGLPAGGGCLKTKKITQRLRDTEKNE